MLSHVVDALRKIRELLVPFFWRPGFVYTLADFRADIVAGATVAVIQIPQSMAFAIIAGLPAVYGLYASLPGFIASIWGSSRQLSTGPVAVVSLLTLTSLVPLAEPGTPEFIYLAGLLAVLVGFIYILMGMFRLGFILHLVPQSVIVGFSTAAASIIVTTQIGVLLGVHIVQHDLVFQNIVDLILAIPRTSVPTVIVGTSAVVMLLLFQNLPKKFPSALSVLIIGIVCGYFLELGTYGIELVKEIPSSLPTFSFPFFSISSLLTLIPKAAIIALVAFLSTYATAKTVAEKTKERLVSDQELIGQGFANIAAGFFKGYPIAGSFTRTALNVEAGARTGIASMVAAAITLVTLLFFTEFFYFLPRAVLAAIVVVAAAPLISVARLREIYQLSTSDGYVAYLTFVIAFLLKPDDAIFIGIVVALLLFVHQTAWGSRIYEMGIDREWHILRSSIEEERVEKLKGICIARVGMSLYYANASHLMDEIDELMEFHASREKEPVRYLVLDMSGVNFIDVTALEVFADYLESLEKRNIVVAVIYLRRTVRRAMVLMPRIRDLTMLHNINELRQFCTPDNARTLTLSGTRPERLREKKFV